MSASIFTAHWPPWLTTFRTNWPEYLMEAIELGVFMISACVFAILLFHPSSSLVVHIESAHVRRFLMGAAMGLTAIALIYSPMGQRSGAHMNPATTLTFWRLGTIGSADAVLYIIAQFSGAICGMMLMRALFHGFLQHDTVRYVTTVPQPGPLGLLIAWIAEFLMALVLMTVVLHVTNSRTLARYTGAIVGLVIMIYIFIEAPLSGTSMNPARSLGASLAARTWTGLWIYFTAPPMAMLLASEIYLRLRGRSQVYCAKLNHFNSARCIFRCRFHEMLQRDAEHLPVGLRDAEVAPEPFAST
jgi:aquaporin Z